MLRAGCDGPLGSVRAPAWASSRETLPAAGRGAHPGSQPRGPFPSQRAPKLVRGARGCAAARAGAGEQRGCGRCAGPAAWLRRQSAGRSRRSPGWAGWEQSCRPLLVNIMGVLGCERLRGWIARVCSSRYVVSAHGSPVRVC